MKALRRPAILKTIAPDRDSRAGPGQQTEMQQNENLDQQGLLSALASLDDRSREIIKSRWLAEKKLTLHDLA